MKPLSALVLFLLTFPVSAFATPPHFDHIIIVIQENRTPDNLFGGNPSFEQGLDIQQGAGGPWCLGACFSPDHSHTSWKKMWNGGGPGWNNGQHACSIVIHDNCFNPNPTTCNGVPVNPPTSLCRPETYVSTTYDNAKVQPYFDIAKRYGFANYFFQTNQGPSYPAHQFLFSGTSAPTGVVNGLDYQYFASKNPSSPLHPGKSKAGCNLSPNDQYTVKVVDQASNESITPVPPCFDHHSLPTILNPGDWKYYASPSDGWATSIWTAPNSISDICLPLQNGNCNGPNWQYVVHGPGQILTDISSCTLPKVSWVIPAGNASDHPGFAQGETDSKQIEDGPAWVANIINSVGFNPICSNGEKYWNNTLILIVWDDWGGWWDHVDPATAPNLGVLKDCGAWGCGFVYGFRVPFLVVSAYMAPSTGGAPPEQGYVSGDTRNQGEIPPYIHDFGSILAFIEKNFQLTQINSQYPFSDHFAPELRFNPTLIPLADFFCVAPCTAQQFLPITLPPDAPAPDYFIHPTYPLTDPDDDAVDDD